MKIGNGSAWQGFYMFAGGTNPADHLQESHATGYPNDLPRFDYDFQAAFGATGHPGPSLGLLRDHNAFLDAFGDAGCRCTARCPTTLPSTCTTWSLCGGQCAAPSATGGSGFLFINTHEPHEPLSGFR